MNRLSNVAHMLVNVCDYVLVLYRKPDRLHKWITVVLDAYNTQQQGTLVKEAQKLMSPAVIVKLEALRQVIEAEFL